MLAKDLDMDEATPSAGGGPSQSGESESAPKKKTISVPLFGYLGFLVLGVYTIIKSLEELPASNLSTVLLWVIFGLTYAALSCFLLKLRNWARITLLVINSIIAVLITLLDLFVFVWIPLTRGAEQSTEVLARTFQNSFFSFTTPDVFAFLIVHFYFYGFLLVFTRPAIKGRFGHHSSPAGTSHQAAPKRKVWPVIAIFSLGIAVCSGVLIFAGSTGPDLSLINIRTQPEKDAISCALVIVRNIKLYSPHKDQLLKKIAIAYAQAGKHEEAMQLVNVLEKNFDKAEILAEIASSHTRAGQYQKACGVLSQALQAADMIDNEFIKSQKKELIALKYLEAGQPDRAIETAYKMKHACCKASVLTNVAFAYFDANQPDKADDFLFKAFETAGQEKNTKIRHNNLVEIAVTYARMGQYDHALQVAETIESSAPRAEALGGIAANVKSEERSRANHVLALALEEVAKIEDATFKATSTANIAVKFAEAGQYNRALQLAYPIEKINARVNALAKIALLYGQAGYTDKAFEILLQASSAAVTAEDDLAILTMGTTIASNYIQIGHKDRASFILSKILPLAYEIKSENLKSSILTSIVAKYAEAGKYVQAYQIARDLNVPTFKANSLVSIIIEYARTEQRPGGYDSKILHEIMKASE